VMVAGRWMRRGHVHAAETRTAPRLAALMRRLWEGT